MFQLPGQFLEHMAGEHLKLVRLPEEVGLVVGDQLGQLAQLGMAAGVVDQKTVVLGERAQAQLLDPFPQAILQAPPAPLGKHQPEVGGDQVGKQLP
jgi:hypothetical protein